MENDLLEKQKDWVQDILREQNYTIIVAEMPILSRAYIAWYRFTIIKSNTDMVSSVDISIKQKAPILIPINDALQITRATEHTRHDLFHIELLETPSLSDRGNGYAILLLIYGMSDLKIKWPNIKFFTLNDESLRNVYIKNNIYNKLGFVFMYEQSLGNDKKGTVIRKDTKKILNFNIETIEHWVGVRCLRIINKLRNNWGMKPINYDDDDDDDADDADDDYIGEGKQKKQKNKKQKKQKNKKTKKQKNKKQKKTKKQKTKKTKNINFI
jgi:hypothetical protein